MRFTQVTSLCLFFLTFGLVFASPTPKAIEKRDGPVAGILTTLQGTVGPIINQINSLVSGGTATTATATPLVNQLVTALNTASGSVSSLSSTTETAEDVASQLASVTTDIVNAVEPLLGIVSTDTLGGLDSALSQLITGLEGLLAGLLNLLATLLVDLAGVLRNLAFGLTLGSLGL